jgi:MoaA/NifB/PqqE/SkfB family radical SAM enzyme
MSLEDMKKVIANIEDMCNRLQRTPYFYITGGDPILHPDFWSLMELIKEKGYPFTIMGNPFHLTDEVCRRLRECGCEKYQLSIDGMRETHDKFRKPGSFDCTLEKIALIRKAGIKCAIMSTVSKVNMDEMEDVVDLVVENKVDIFAFGRYCPTSEEKECGIAPLEYRDFLDRIWTKY